MRIVGLDLSLTATGVAHDFGTATLTSRAKGAERLAVLLHLAGSLCGFKFHDYDAAPEFSAADLVVIEGYSMGTARQSSHAHGLGELGGVVRLALFEAGIAYVDVAPASLKKYATGKGNASKDEVYGEAIRRLGYAGKSNDEADALWLRAMALDAYGEPPVTMPALNRSALTAVHWPALATITTGAA